MNTVPHLPVLRLGRSYESLDKLEIKDHRTGEVKAVVSHDQRRHPAQGLPEARRSARGAEEIHRRRNSSRCRRRRASFSSTARCRSATRATRNRADEYVATLSATSGLPHVMVRRNMAKIHYALTHLGEVLNGLSRGLDIDDHRQRLRRAVRHEALVFPDLPGARARHAEQFARGEFALAPGHRAEDAGRHQARPRRAVDAVPADPGVHRRGCAGGGVRLLSDRPRGRGRDPEDLRARAHLRRQEHDGAVREQSGDPAPRAGLEQVPHRRRLHRELARLHRRHRRRDQRQRRTLLHQCQRRRGAEVRRGNRRRARAEARPDRSRRGTTIPNARLPASRTRRWPTSSTRRSRTA